MSIPIYQRTKEKQPVQFPYNFQPAAPFGGQKKGERERCVKGLPAQGRAGIVENHSHSHQNISCAPLTQRESSPKLRTPKGAAGVYSSVGFSLGYDIGFVRAELIAKKAHLWYNNMDRQAKIIFLPAACAAPLCFRKAALCLNTALANHCKQVCSLALWTHKQTERFHITEK